MSIPTSTQVRNALGEVYAFVRSRDVNKVLSAVTIEQLIQEQIARNGESGQSAANAQNQTATPGSTDPAGQEPINSTFFVSGTDVNQPSVIEQLNAAEEELKAIVDYVKTLEPVELLDEIVEDSQDADPITTNEAFVRSS